MLILRFMARGLLYAIMLIPAVVLTAISLMLAGLCCLAGWDLD